MKNNSYRILKLISGEELITRIKGQKNGKVIIERPMVFKSSTMIDSFGATKEITILKNWLLYSTNNQTTIPQDFIASYLKPDIDVLKLYTFEKKKDDYLNSQSNKKSRIIKKNPRSPRNIKNINNFDDKQNIEGFIDFLNQVKGNNITNKSMMEKIINDIQNLDDSEFDELKRNSEENDEKENDDYVNYITMTLFLPPESLISLVDSGLIDENEVKEMIKGINDMNQSSKNNKGGLTEFLDYFKRGPDEYGNDWRDWSPYPSDYEDNKGPKL